MSQDKETDDSVLLTEVKLVGASIAKECTIKEKDNIKKVKTLKTLFILVKLQNKFVSYIFMYKL